MKFTDLFVKRPVLATVINLMILVLGLRSIAELPIRQFPFTQNAVVTITTVYTGADPELIAGFITTPLENSIAQANGIDYMTSVSNQNQSIISVNLRLNYDPIKAVSEINTKVNAVLNLLPAESQQPTITVAVGETIDSMYIGFNSDVLASNQITDYILRVVQPKLQTVEGVQTAEILGPRQFAMRAWLIPEKLAGYGITAQEVSVALARNDFISAVGRTNGQMITVNLTAETGLHSVKEFENLILKSVDGAIIRLKDVANVSLGAENYDTAVKFDGKSAVYIGIQVAPSANLLTVIDNIRKLFPTLQEQFPNGLNGKIVYDATKYVHAAIDEVIVSLIEALLIVTLVIFLFLGSFRSVIIPVIAMPLSLIGAVFMMYLLGFSINLLTLLALVLGIGLVVDDAIIVVENIYRHIEEGVSPFKAAILGARELANPIIAITVVLIAVYLPIGFMGGLTGALFTEFAFSLAGAVTISAVIALTLSPMMCSKMLKPTHNGKKNKLVTLIDNTFEHIKNKYHNALHRSLDHLSMTIVFAVIIFISIYFLYTTSNAELAPQEDQGVVITQLTTAPNATIHQTELYSAEIFKDFIQYKEYDHGFQLDGVNGLNSGIAGMVLKPWDERKRTTNDIQPGLQQELSNIAGANVVAFQPPSLPGSRGLPVQFVIQTTETFDRLNEVSLAILDKARKSGIFAYVDTDLKIDKEQTTIELNRDKASDMGLTMQDVGQVLASFLGGNYINLFSLGGRSYKVIPQVTRTERLNAEQLKYYYINAQNGLSVPLSTIATLKSKVVPESLNHFQQINSATISGVSYVPMGQTLKTLENISKDILPQGYSIDYAGQSRQYITESGGLLVTFVFAMIIIYLSLAALFESFKDPLIVLISVPMSICGALIFISMGIGGASLNIYSQVGLITLIGLISKHGILIVQFANDLQKEGKSKREAIESAAAIRLRPILMTTAAMVLGVIPLILSTGAGAVSRFNIGLVISTGISIGTLFTLFVVPAMYLWMADRLEADSEQQQES